MAATIANDSLYALAEDILRIYSGGGLRNNTTLSIPQIGHWINTHYADILHKEIQQYQRAMLPVPQDLWATLTCKKLKEEDKSGCECIKTGCVVKYITLPDYMSIDGVALIKAYSTTFNEEINIYNSPSMASNSIRAIGGFGKSKMAAYLIGKKLAFVFPPDKINTCFVTITGVFTSISTAYRCNDIWSRGMGIPQR